MEDDVRAPKRPGEPGSVPDVTLDHLQIGMIGKPSPGEEHDVVHGHGVASGKQVRYKDAADVPRAAGDENLLHYSIIAVSNDVMAAKNLLSACGIRTPPAALCAYHRGSFSVCWPPVDARRECFAPVSLRIMTRSDHIGFNKPKAGVIQSCPSSQRERLRA